MSDSDVEPPSPDPDVDDDEDNEHDDEGDAGVGTAMNNANYSCLKSCSLNYASIHMPMPMVTRRGVLP